MSFSNSEPRPPGDGAQKNETDGSSHAGSQPQQEAEFLTRRDWRVRKVVALLTADLSRRWTLDDLAEEVRIGPRQLERLFKQETGFAPLQLLKAMRLEHACRELERSCKSVAEIAAEAGYRPKGHHFERDFKREYGHAPSAYRTRFAAVQASNHAGG